MQNVFQRLAKTIRMKTLIIRHDVKNHDLYLSFASDIPSLFFYKIEKYVGTDGRAVASDTKDQQIRSRHLLSIAFKKPKIDKKCPVWSTSNKISTANVN